MAGEYVGKITKFDIDRLEQRNPELYLDCPNCGTARLVFYFGTGTGMNDVQCPKCSHRIILDTLNLTVINEGMPAKNKNKRAELANIV